MPGRVVIVTTASTNQRLPQNMSEMKGKTATTPVSAAQEEKDLPFGFSPKRAEALQQQG